MAIVEDYVNDVNARLEREGLAGRVTVSPAAKSVMLTKPYQRWPWDGDPGELPGLLGKIVRWAKAQRVTNPLHRYMLLRDLSTRKAGKLLGVSHHRVFELMQEEANPSIETRVKIERKTNGEVGRDAWPNPIPGQPGRPLEHRPTSYIKGR
jgi:hypothetical protein